MWVWLLRSRQLHRLTPFPLCSPQWPLQKSNSNGEAEAGHLWKLYIFCPATPVHLVRIARSRNSSRHRLFLLGEDLRKFIFSYLLSTKKRDRKILSLLFLCAIRSNTYKKKRYFSVSLRWSSAEREGFEPPEPRSSTVFKTAAIDHSAISPTTKVEHFFELTKYFWKNFIIFFFTPLQSANNQKKRGWFFFIT